MEKTVRPKSGHCEAEEEGKDPGEREGWKQVAEGLAADAKFQGMPEVSSLEKAAATCANIRNLMEVAKY